MTSVTSGTLTCQTCDRWRQHRPGSMSHLEFTAQLQTIALLRFLLFDSICLRRRRLSILVTLVRCEECVGRHTGGSSPRRHRCILQVRRAARMTWPVCGESKATQGLLYAGKCTQPRLRGTSTAQQTKCESMRLFPMTDRTGPAHLTKSHVPYWHATRFPQEKPSQQLKAVSERAPAAGAARRRSRARIPHRRR